MLQLSASGLAQIKALTQVSNPNYPAAYQAALTDLENQYPNGLPAGADADSLQWINVALQVNSGANTIDAVAIRASNVIAKLRASLPLLQQKRDIFRSVANISGTSKVALLEAEQAALEAEHDLAIQQTRTAQVAAALEALLRQVAQQQATYTHELLKDLSDARQHADELTQQVAAAAQRAKQTVLTAPIAGTVQQLAIHTLGGVVTPAQPLLTLVPTDAPVLIEATVANDDIGFVAAGQPVEVKVKTFPFTRYGLLHGRVLDVSRDAVRQESSAAPKQGKAANSGDDTEGKNLDAPSSGYVAHVALNRTSLDVDGHAVALTPGMEITAEIKTGRRRVISYLLSPLRRYAHNAMVER
jgi:hemolysin D